MSRPTPPPVRRRAEVLGCVSETASRNAPTGIYAGVSTSFERPPPADRTGTPAQPPARAASSPPPMSVRFRARRWRLLLIPSRSGVPRLREVTLAGPWLVLRSGCGTSRWDRDTVDVTCVSPPRSAWARALPTRMLLVSPRARGVDDGAAAAPESGGSRGLVFDCSVLSASDFAQLRRHVNLFTEIALLRATALRPSLGVGRLWERPSLRLPES